MTSRGRRTQRRAAERRTRGTTSMTIPDHIRQLTDQPAPKEDRRDDTV